MTYNETMITDTHALTTNIFVSFGDGTYGYVDQGASFGDIGIAVALVAVIFLQVVQIWILATSLRSR
jgi:hypothetical protein